MNINYTVLTFLNPLVEELKKTLAQTLLASFEAKQTDAATMREAANYILDNSASVKTDADASVFLEKLKTQWPLFEDVYRVYSYRANKDKEKEVLERLRSHIKGFSFKQ